ncbi:MAG TPA: hypothetical protein PKZ07_14495 [Sedimentisphaerales bacterium]|nr:hypothetical protein [Sedimentisphaerales bacterium]
MTTVRIVDASNGHEFTSFKEFDEQSAKAALEKFGNYLIRRVEVTVLNERNGHDPTLADFMNEGMGMECNFQVLVMVLPPLGA